MSEFMTNMRTDVGLDAMTAMLPYLTNIINDPEYRAIKANTDKTKVVDLLPEAYSLIVGKHRGDFYGIVSAVTKKTIDEVRAQPLEETMEVFRGATGNDVIGFFTSCALMAARV